MEENNKLTYLARPLAPKTCLDSIVDDLNPAALCIANEKLLEIGRIHVPLEEAYKVNCDGADCKSHIYIGSFQLCTSQDVRMCMNYANQQKQKD